jgi:hypothetical protein
MMEGEIFMYVFSELKLLTPCVRRCRSIRSVIKECEIFKSARFLGANGQCEGSFNLISRLSTVSFSLTTPVNPGFSVLGACTRKIYNYRAAWRTVSGTLAAVSTLGSKGGEKMAPDSTKVTGCAFPDNLPRTIYWPSEDKLLPVEAMT